MAIRKYILLSFLFFWSIPVLAQVDTAWVRRYHGPGGLGDVAYAVAVDDSGNVYVTGYSVGSGTGPDYTTIKYASNGDTVWLRRYNGPGNDDDVATALAVDNSGNVYVTGYSIGIGTAEDYVTIKYAPNGDTLWVRRYNRSGSDYGNALVVDDSGNVYVTGDPITIKYSLNGDMVWDFVGIKGVSLTVEDSGYVYTTGSSTVKYSPNGGIEWALGYGGRDIAVDDSGNVYTTNFGATYKFGADGEILWASNNYVDVPSDLALDDSGNVYVAGYSNRATYPDYATVKHAPDGDTLWVRRYSGAGYDNLVHDLAVEKNGNVYVTGRSIGLGTGNDYATIMYTPNGDTLWVRRYNGPGNYNDHANALTVDDSGYVYVTGESFGIGTYPDYATIKYFPCLAKPGDANGSGGNPNLTDIIYLVNYSFKGGPAPSPTCRGDANASGGNGNLTDIIYLVNYVFKDGPAPPEIAMCCL
ncbi:MAG: NHL repeat containing protein [candidate division Zixibacteria bacterium RBG-1]|nr:MAG: NHL repeat containing protein [candidate division Zixibacteria bacterium RBG-1]OGC85556.1 MAG: hypothetical protein A2V73_06340 [candidate division Zixibacteria bacterium RBG_19FT_COMBO_42_43]